MGGWWCQQIQLIADPITGEEMQELYVTCKASQEVPGMERRATLWSSYKTICMLVSPTDKVTSWRSVSGTTAEWRAKGTHYYRIYVRW